MSDWSRWPAEDVQPTLDEMTFGELIDAYRERFGAAALPWFFDRTADDLQALAARMRQALRDGRPIPPEPLPELPDGTVI